VELVVSESKQGFVNLNVKNGIENDYDEWTRKNEFYAKVYQYES
jgi:hypothetical protein